MDVRVFIISNWCWHVFISPWIKIQQIVAHPCIRTNPNVKSSLENGDDHFRLSMTIRHLFSAVFQLDFEFGRHLRLFSFDWDRCIEQCNELPWIVSTHVKLIVSSLFVFVAKSSFWNVKRCKSDGPELPKKSFLGCLIDQREIVWKKNLIEDELQEVSIQIYLWLFRLSTFS